MTKMKRKMDALLPDDLELLLREISEFCNSNSARLDEVPQSLENYLHYVAKSGNTVFPWQHVRPLFKHKLNTAIGQFQGESSSVEAGVHERFDLFRAAPFTIQRLTELILQPLKHYKTKEKFVFALEKTVFVVSTVEPRSPQDYDVTNGKEDDLENENLDETEAMSYEESDHRQHQDLQLSTYIPAVGIDQPTRNINEVFATIEQEPTTDTEPVTVSSSIDTPHNVLPGGSGEGEHGHEPEFETSYVSEMLKLPSVDASVEGVHDGLEYPTPTLHHNIEVSHVEEVEPRSPQDYDVTNGKEDDLENENLDETKAMAYEESDHRQHQDLQLSSYIPAVGSDQPTRNINEVFATVEQEPTTDTGPVTVSSSIDTPHNVLPGGSGEGEDGHEPEFETSYVSEMLKLPSVVASAEGVHDGLEYPTPTLHHNIEVSHVEEDERVDSATADIAELASVAGGTEIAEEPSSSTTVVSNLDAPTQGPALDWTHLTGTS